jgi:hypothetical protein
MRKRPGGHFYSNLEFGCRWTVCKFNNVSKTDDSLFIVTKTQPLQSLELGHLPLETICH